MLLDEGSKPSLAFRKKGKKRAKKGQTLEKTRKKYVLSQISFRPPKPCKIGRLKEFEMSTYYVLKRLEKMVRSVRLELTRLPATA